MNSPGHSQVPLWEKPVLLQIGTARHGSRPEESYRLPGIWCLHHYNYEAGLRAGSLQIPLQPGSVTLMPPGMSLHYTYRGPSTHQFAHFVLPSGRSRLASLPLHVDPDRTPDGFGGKFQETIRMGPTSSEHASIRLWDLLWDLADAVGAGQDEGRALPLPVEKTLEAIEARLADPIRIPDLARAAGLSQNQLNRLFHRHVGQNLISTIRRRRTERAIHLLRNTDLPFRTIAQASGLGDPHSFNKTIRAMTNQSPTRIRSLGPVRLSQSTLPSGLI